MKSVIEDQERLSLKPLPWKLFVDSLVLSVTLLFGTDFVLSIAVGTGDKKMNVLLGVTMRLLGKYCSWFRLIKMSFLNVPHGGHEKVPLQSTSENISIWGFFAS